MRDLARSLYHTGAPVPVPWPYLGDLVRPRAGDLMVVFAAPGVGKSTFALNWVANITEPSLYVSLDTTLVDHAVRLLAMKKGLTVDEVTVGYEADQRAWAERWEPEVVGLDLPVRFAEPIYGGVQAIGELVEADAEYWGTSPKLTVVDNVSDLIEGEESAQEYGRIMRELRRIAKDQQTCILALHHPRRRPPKPGARDEDRDDDQASRPVHASDILYAADRNVQFLLGMWRPRSDRMRVGVLKNRMGPANPNGHVFAPLEADLARARLVENQAVTYMETTGNGAWYG